MITEELDEIWGELTDSPVSEEISGRRIADMPLDRPVYVGKDNRGLHHLLIYVPKEKNLRIQFRTRGLSVDTSKFKIGSNKETTCIDLVCENPSQNSTFNAVSSDIIRSIKKSETDLQTTIEGALQRWKDFWSARTGGLGLEETLGLFGELWLILRWFPKVDNTVMEMWQRTENSIHDFQFPKFSIEVKTAQSRGSSDPTHYISGLDQLDDPVQGDLYLFSLQLTEDALSSNTLHHLVNSIMDKIGNDYRTFSIFKDKILARGYTFEDSGAPARGFKVLSERLYLIDKGFPRITRNSFGTRGIPDGILDVRYSLDMTACKSWLIADSPADNRNPLKLAK
jgi:hypothetical protein